MWPGTSQFSHRVGKHTFLGGMIALSLYHKGDDALTSAGIRDLQALYSFYAIGQAVQCLFSSGTRDRMQLVFVETMGSFLAEGTYPKRKLQWQFH